MKTDKFSCTLDALCVTGAIVLLYVMLSRLYALAEYL